MLPCGPECTVVKFSSHLVLLKSGSYFSLSTVRCLSLFIVFSRCASVHLPFPPSLFLSGATALLSCFVCVCVCVCEPENPIRSKNVWVWWCQCVCVCVPPSEDWPRFVWQLHRSLQTPVWFVVYCLHCMYTDRLVHDASQGGYPFNKRYIHLHSTLCEHGS